MAKSITEFSYKLLLDASNLVGEAKLTSAEMRDVRERIKEVNQPTKELSQALVDNARAFSEGKTSYREFADEAKRLEALTPAAKQREHNETLKEGKAVTDQYKTHLQKYNEEVAHLNKLHDAGAISHGTFNTAMRHSRIEAVESIPVVGKLVEAMREIPVVGKLMEGMITSGPIAGLAVGAGVLAVGAGIKMAEHMRESVKEATVELSAVRGQAKLIGAGVEELEGLQVVAHARRIEADELKTGMMFMQRFLGGEQAKGTILGLGLDFAELKKQSPVQQIREITEAVGKLTDANERMHTVRAIFGRGGQNMLKLGGVGEEEYDELEHEGRKRGGIQSKADIDKVYEATGSARELKEVWEGLARTAAVELAPATKEWNDALRSLIENDSVREGIKSLFGGIATGAEIAAGAVNALGKSLPTISEPVEDHNRRRITKVPGTGQEVDTTPSDWGTEKLANLQDKLKRTWSETFENLRLLMHQANDWTGQGAEVQYVQAEIARQELKKSRQSGTWRDDEKDKAKLSIEQRAAGDSLTETLKALTKARSENNVSEVEALGIKARLLVEGGAELELQRKLEGRPKPKTKDEAIHEIFNPESEEAEDVRSGRSVSNKVLALQKSAKAAISQLKEKQAELNGEDVTAVKLAELKAEALAQNNAELMKAYQLAEQLETERKTKADAYKNDQADAAFIKASKQRIEAMAEQAATEKDHGDATRMGTHELAARHAAVKAVTDAQREQAAVEIVAAQERDRQAADKAFITASKQRIEVMKEQAEFEKDHGDATRMGTHELAARHAAVKAVTEAEREQSKVEIAAAQERDRQEEVAKLRKKDRTPEQLYKETVANLDKYREDIGEDAYNEGLKKARKAWTGSEKLKTPAEELKEETDKLTAQLKNHVITWQEYGRLKAEAIRKWDEAGMHKGGVEAMKAGSMEFALFQEGQRNERKFRQDKAEAENEGKAALGLPPEEKEEVAEQLPREQVMADRRAAFEQAQEAKRAAFRGRQRPKPMRIEPDDYEMPAEKRDGEDAARIALGGSMPDLDHNPELQPDNDAMLGDMAGAAGKRADNAAMVGWLAQMAGSMAKVADNPVVVESF